MSPHALGLILSAIDVAEAHWLSLKDDWEKRSYLLNGNVGVAT